MGRGHDPSIATLQYLHFFLSELYERPWNKRGLFQGSNFSFHLGRPWVLAQQCCSEPPANCYSGMWKGWSPAELQEMARPLKPEPGMVKAHGCHGEDDNGSIFQRLAMSREKYEQGKKFPLSLYFYFNPFYLSCFIALHWKTAHFLVHTAAWLSIAWQQCLLL